MFCLEEEGLGQFLEREGDQELEVELLSEAVIYQAGTDDQVKPEGVDFVLVLEQHAVCHHPSHLFGLLGM